MGLRLSGRAAKWDKQVGVFLVDGHSELLWTNANDDEHSIETTEHPYHTVPWSMREHHRVCQSTTEYGIVPMPRSAAQSTCEVICVNGASTKPRPPVESPPLPSSCVTCSPTQRGYAVRQRCLCGSAALPHAR